MVHKTAHKLCVILCLALCLALSAAAQEVTPDPQETSRPYLSVFTHADYAQRPAEARLIDNLQRSPLLEFARDCRFRHYTDRDPIYRERFASQFIELPAICVQRPDGGVWYKSSGAAIPREPGQLLEEIRFYRDLDPGLFTSPLPWGEVASNASGRGDDPWLRLANQFSNWDQCGPDGCPPRQPANPYQPDQPGFDPLPDSTELFGGRTPIRDSLASMAWMAAAVIGSFFLGFIVIVALIILVLIRPKP